ncbi:uncharacterized protein BX664DRAFT_342490 [Halteromyces radiatus]|uniref:uncharacterized protein n=1 Tax=Halteromyces radiatus TaxID=101107 RepID=UPI00221FD666|nr:uncharacterized protein BX664DRAFT_342490 [Halteromyces radiatus]KAI8078690.1 hypothetical protein BX664DRAFT_342490 [Halteromyces radiatus]
MTSLQELRQRLFHPYYVLHFVYGSFLVFYRLFHLVQNRPLTDVDSNALLLMVGLGIWKCVMASTAEELTSVLILYTKVFTLWSLYWNAGIWKTISYIVGWIVLSTIFPQPWYRGPTKLIELTESSFRNKVCPVKKKPTSSSSSTTTSSPSSTTSTVPINEIKGPRITEIDDDNNNNVKYWVVMLYANWSISCLNFEAVLAKLSLQYDASHIKFGKIDVDIYTDIAQEFGVSRDPASFDLPTLVLFQNGTEIRRLPELTIQDDNKSNTNAAKDTITRLGWSKKPATVIHAFQLDKLRTDHS